MKNQQPLSGRLFVAGAATLAGAGARAAEGPAARLAPDTKAHEHA